MTMREGAGLLSEKTPLKTTLGAAIALVVGLCSLLAAAWQFQDAGLTRVRAETREMVSKAVEPMLKRDEFYLEMKDLRREMFEMERRLITRGR